MPITAQLLDQAEARRLLHQQLELPTMTRTVVVPDAIIAEYLRSAIYELSTVDGERPVYVTALAHRVRDQLSSVWPQLARTRNQRPSLKEQQSEGDTAPDPIRRVLQTLQDVRDFVHVGNGYWLPGPLRLVDLRIGSALVIAGMSTASLRLLIPELCTAGIARTVPMEALANYDDYWEDLDSWLGMSHASLDDWTDERLAHARTSLLQSASELLEFEIYDPERRGREPQAFRWVAAHEYTKGASAGLVLCRTNPSRFGPRRFWLGTVRRAREGWRPERESPVPIEDVRRLQYGLDRKAGTPTRVEIRQRHGSVMLTFRNLLPPEERRLLMIVGEECSEITGRFPLKYSISNVTYPALHAALTGLGIQI